MKRYILSEKHTEGDILHISLRPKYTNRILTFEAGQYAALSFRGPSGRPSTVRCFSFTNAAQGSRELQFSIRVQGDFTQGFQQAPIGTDVFVNGPFGKFFVDDDDPSLVMIAGGIGITPFLSMIRTAAQIGDNRRTLLVYSHRQSDDPFLQELRELEAQHAWLTIVDFVTRSASISPSSSTIAGKMTKEHLSQIVDKFRRSTYFICGPGGFIAATEQQLLKKGVSSSQIIIESFTQSSESIAPETARLRRVTYMASSGLLIAGIGVIGVLDLVRFIPAHAMTNTPVSTSSPTQTNPSTTTIAPTQTYSNSSNSSNSSQSSPAPTPSYNYTYQAPVSSVS